MCSLMSGSLAVPSCFNFYFICYLLILRDQSRKRNSNNDFKSRGEAGRVAKMDAFACLGVGSTWVKL